MRRIWAILGVLLLAGALAPENWLRRGNVAFERGDYQTALDCYSRAADDTLDPGQVAFNQAAAYYRLGEFATAEACYRRALEDAAGVRRVKALYGLANALAQQGQLRRGRGAIGQLRDAVARHQECVAAVDALDQGDSDDVRDVREYAQFNLNLVKPLLEQKLADPTPENSPSNPDPSNRPPDESGNPFPSRDPRDRGSRTEGSRSNGQRGPPGSESPLPANGQAQGTDDTQAGRGNLPPLTDDKTGPPLSPDQALDYLQQNLDRIHKDRANRMKPPTANIRGAKDW